MNDRLKEIIERYAPSSVEDNLWVQSDSTRQANENAEHWWKEACRRKEDVRYLLSLIEQGPPACARELPGHLPGTTTRCVLARGHAGQCDPTTRHEVVLIRSTLDSGEYGLWKETPPGWTPV